MGLSWRIFESMYQLKEHSRQNHNGISMEIDKDKYMIIQTIGMEYYAIQREQINKLLITIYGGNN